MSEWTKDQHVATYWITSQFHGGRVGTGYVYEHNVDLYRNHKGFRWRPKYLKWLRKSREERIIQCETAGFKFDLKVKR